MRRILICLLVLLAGCSADVTLRSGPTGEAGPKDPNVRSVTPYDVEGVGNGFDFAYLATVEHDGHAFVVYRNAIGGGMLHHPDCTCTQRKDTLETDFTLNQ